MAEQQMMPPAFINLLGRGSAFVVTGLLIWSFDFRCTGRCGFCGRRLFMLVLALRSAASFHARLRPNLSAQVVLEGARTAVVVRGRWPARTAANRIGVIALVFAGRGGRGRHLYHRAETGRSRVPAVGVHRRRAAYPRLCQAFADPNEFQKVDPAGGDDRRAAGVRAGAGDVSGGAAVAGAGAWANGSPERKR